MIEPPFQAVEEDAFPNRVDHWWGVRLKPFDQSFTVFPYCNAQSTLNPALKQFYKRLIVVELAPAGIELDVYIGEFNTSNIPIGEITPK